MSGLIHKLTHRHDQAATTTTATPVLATQTNTLNTSAGLAQPTLLKSSGGVMMGTNVLNTTTPLTTSTTTIQQPIQHQTTHVAAPIIQETVRNDKVIEVQPVLHREVDQNVVHHIEKHYTEVAPSMGGVVERPAVVQQAVHTNIVNEIQPIIHRERVVPVVERTEQHLTQHIVQPTIHTHEVVYERGTFQQSGLNISGQQTILNQGLVGSTGLSSYQGLNMPYTNAMAHPTYGYQRLPRDRKAERFELKAAEWQRRGNLVKANKNREKALRLRQRSQPGYVAPVRPQTYYVDRANLFDQKALRYQQWGMMPQSQRYQQRAMRLRGKHNLPLAQQNNLYTQPGQSLLPQGINGQNLYSQGMMPQDKLLQQQQFNQPQQFTSAR